MVAVDVGLSAVSHEQEVVEAADAVIAAIDETALAKLLARKTPEEGPGAAARKKEAEEQKAALLDALEKKASALLELHPTAPEKSPSAEAPEEQVPCFLAHALALSSFQYSIRCLPLTCISQITACHSYLCQFSATCPLWLHAVLLCMHACMLLST